MTDQQRYEMAKAVEKKIDAKLAAERREIKTKIRQAEKRFERDSRARTKIERDERAAWLAFEKTGEDESSAEFSAWKQAHNRDVRAGADLLRLANATAAYKEKLARLDSDVERDDRIARERRFVELRNRSRTNGGNTMTATAEKTRTTKTGRARNSSVKKSNVSTEIREAVESALSTAKLKTDLATAVRFGVMVVKIQKGLRSSKAEPSYFNISDAEAKKIVAALKDLTGTSATPDAWMKQVSANGKPAPTTKLAKTSASKQATPDPKEKKTTSRKRAAAAKK